jgi:copper chaperone NosL
MRVDASGLAAGATSTDGATLAFDSAKCLFRYRLAHEGLRDAWVTDYYARTHRPITTAFFVVGSDVMGAMGADLVALSSREEAERFSREHHGTSILALDQVDRAVVDRLFGAH